MWWQLFGPILVSDYFSVERLIAIDRRNVREASQAIIISPDTCSTEYSSKWKIGQTFIFSLLEFFSLFWFRSLSHFLSRIFHFLQHLSLTENGRSHFSLKYPRMDSQIWESCIIPFFGTFTFYPPEDVSRVTQYLEVVTPIVDVEISHLVWSSRVFERVLRPFGRLLEAFRGF